MHPSIQEHRVPISVTAVGLVVAAILASAPALLAESDTEILTKKNASDLQALSSSIDKSTSDFQQQLDAQASAQLAAIDRLQNQVAILNKATGRLNQKQATMIKPAMEMSGSFQSLKTNAQTRLTNLEKAITRVNQRQRNLISAIDNDNSPGGPDNNTALRLSNLEKAVTRVNQRHQKLTTVVDNNSPSEPDSNTALRLSNLEKGVKNLHMKTVSNQRVDNNDDLTGLEQRLAALESRCTAVPGDFAERLMALELLSQSPATDQSARLATLERQVDQLLNRRPAGTTMERSSQADIKRRVEMDIRLLRLERQFKRLEDRLEDVNGAAREQEMVVDQLFEMRSYIDTLLSEIYR